MLAEARIGFGLGTAFDVRMAQLTLADYAQEQSANLVH